MPPAKPLTGLVLLSIFTESMVGGIAVHSSNLYQKLLADGVEVARVDYGAVIAARQRGAWGAALSGFFQLLFRTLRLRLRGHRFFHFHASNLALPYLVLCLPLYLSGARLALSIHSGYGFDKWLDDRPLLARLDGWAFRLLRALIFMNPEESAAVARRYPQLAGRIVTINPYIAPRAEALPERPPAPQRFTVSTIGAWGKRYNVQEAVRGALRFHRETGVPTTVRVIQSTALVEPDYRQATLGEFERYRTEIDVELYEDTDQILSLLAGSDVFVRPSLGDSYGLCVAEALLVGTPAIVTDICRRCRAALLYQPGDLDRLTALLKEVYQQKADGLPRRRLLDADEDAYNNYRRLYQRIATG